ncbi:hypothetical protein BEL04_09760 [Mucilaginibacter sp. PPCGB 2223]|uniref:hypothetical protein n=1 Tax=Mucilaginibacter sp. PPCGB 2223 TaxID=1886027 RepID=UPI000826DF6F|nr:hypothetical protein [Mucilaginibacter sp. PPCGB 2223]OCX54511.1 hypothetical protein BEL04_09760 [Mucilaginibacter sp. PPCGB 2223]
MRQVLVDQSIEKLRLVYFLRRGALFDRIMIFFLVAIWPIIVIWSYFDTIDAFIILIWVLGYSWFLVSLYFTYKIVKVSGSTIELNKELMWQLLDNDYRTINMGPENPDVLRFERYSGMLDERVKAITIIFKEADLYINTHFYSIWEFLFFSGFRDYSTSKKIAKRFKTELAKQAIPKFT